MFGLCDIKLQYGDLKVLDHFNLDCERQQFICLFGPSGTGKTSILNILAGIIMPASGQVTSASMRLAYVFQEPRLLPWLTVVENLQIGLYSHGLPARERRQRVENLLPLLGLDGFGGYYPEQLSGGMKQRVSIGRAFAVEPDLLLLDEPFSGLDEEIKRDMQELLSSLGQWHACTTVMVTHDLKEAVRLSDRIVVLRGRPCQIIRDLHLEPEQRYQASYIQRMEKVLSDALNPLEAGALI